MKRDCCCEVTTADAGENQVIDVNFTTLDANKPSTGCGRWTVVSGSGTFKNRKKYNTLVTNLSDGDNVFKWRISHDCRDCPCSEYSEDIVVITYSLVGSSPSSSVSSSSSSSASASVSPSSSRSSSISSSLSRSSSISSSASSSVSSSPSPEGAWFNSDCSWDYRVKITIDNTKVDADLTNFPVYVDLNDLPAEFHTNVNQTDARDIRVTTSDEVTEVAREVVFYDSTTDTGELHFIAPALSNASNTEFYIYYGNPAATEPAAGDANGKNNVWTNGYAGVWHLNETVNNNADGYLDSSGTGNDGTGTSMAISAPTGKIGDAQEFDGTADQINCADDASLDITQGTLSCWINTSNAGAGYRGVLTRVGNYAIFMKDNEFMFYDWGGGGEHFSGVTPNNGAWRQLSLVFDSGVANGSRFYVDGSAGATATMTIGGDPSFPLEGFHIGSEAASFFAGKIDEARLINGMLTSTWISTEYNNQNDPSTFYAVGAEEPCGG